MTDAHREAYERRIAELERVVAELCDAAGLAFYLPATPAEPTRRDWCTTCRKWIACGGGPWCMCATPTPGEVPRGPTPSGFDAPPPATPGEARKPLECSECGERSFVVGPLMNGRCAACARYDEY